MEPILSICVLTYNHAKYIEQAMESVLQQKFDFPIEIIVADDASTDGTQEILKEKYSEVARLLLREKNIGAVKNLSGLLQETTGKYVIVLEGDDFWHIGNAISDMVYFLETNSKYVATSAIRDIGDENGEIISKAIYKSSNNPVMTLRRFMCNEMFDWSATLIRREVVHTFDFALACRTSRNVGDLTFCLMILQQGNIWLINSTLGVYRSQSKEGASNYNSTVSFWGYFTEHIKMLDILKKELEISLSWKKKYSYYIVKALYHSPESRQMKYYSQIIQKVGFQYFLYAYFNYLCLRIREKQTSLKNKIRGLVK